MGGGANVEVFGSALQQQVTDAATHKIGDVVVLVKPVQDLQSVWIYVTPRNRMLGPRNDGRLNHRRRL